MAAVHHWSSSPSLVWLHPGLVPVLHVVRVVRDLLDHVLEEVVAREDRVQLAVRVLVLEDKKLYFK